MVAPAPEGARTEDPIRLRLASILSEVGPVAVALSGGVDSSLLLSVAHEVLGDAAVGAVGVSPSLATAELEDARAVAASIGAGLLEIPTHELDRPGYVANDGARCYHCKTELYLRIAGHPDLAGRTVLDGTNADDIADDRPGMRAAREREVRSPLREAGLGKTAIRAWARERGLAVWDKPARPCLASRVPVGTTVDAERLRAAERLEGVLSGAGFRVHRARVEREAVTVELGRDELPRLEEPGWRHRFVSLARELGFARVRVDERGYGAPGPPRLRDLLPGDPSARELPPGTRP